MMNRKEIIKRLDTLCQTCARYKGAKKKGKVWVNTCVTCGRTLPVRGKIQGGHFIPRGCYVLRWEDGNVNPQCCGCNNYKNGAYIEYSHFFLEKYGKAAFDTAVRIYELHKAGKVRALKLADLRVLYNDWLKKGRELEKKLGLSLFPKSWEPEPADYEVQAISS